MPSGENEICNILSTFLPGPFRFTYPELTCFRAKSNTPWRPDCICSKDKNYKVVAQLSDIKKPIYISDKTIYYEPAEISSVPNGSFIYHPLVILNPAFIDDSTADGTSQTNSKSSKEIQTIKYKRKDNFAFKANPESKDTPIYLDIDIKHPSDHERSSKVQSRSSDSIQLVEDHLKDCLDLHILINFRKKDRYNDLKEIWNDDKLKKYYNLSNSDLIIEIQNKCNHSADFIEQSFQEIKASLPKRNTLEPSSIEPSHRSTKTDVKTRLEDINDEILMMSTSPAPFETTINSNNGQKKYVSDHIFLENFSSEKDTTEKGEAIITTTEAIKIKTVSARSTVHNEIVEKIKDYKVDQYISPRTILTEQNTNNNKLHFDHEYNVDKKNDTIFSPLDFERSPDTLNKVDLDEQLDTTTFATVETEQDRDENVIKTTENDVHESQAKKQENIHNSEVKSEMIVLLNSQSKTKGPMMPESDNDNSSSNSELLDQDVLPSTVIEIFDKTNDNLGRTNDYSYQLSPSPSYMHDINILNETLISDQNSLSSSRKHDTDSSSNPLFSDQYDIDSKMIEFEDTNFEVSKSINISKPDLSESAKISDSSTNEVTNTIEKEYDSIIDATIVISQGNRTKLPESEIKIPKIKVKEYANNTVISDVTGFEYLSNSDFVTENSTIITETKINNNDISDQLTSVDSLDTNHSVSADSERVMTEPSITGQLYFLYDDQQLPARFVQNPDGKINLGIDAQALCDRLTSSSENRPSLLSIMCNCVNFSNCTKVINK